MPLTDALAIHCRAGRLELAVELTDPGRDAPADLARAADRVSRSHRRLVMLDPDLLDEPELGVATVIESRDPVPEPTRRALAELGFEHEVHRGGGARGWGGRRREALHRFLARYRRAAEVHPHLAEAERVTAEADPDARLAALDHWAGVAATDGRGLEARLRIRAPDRLVLAPELVEALGAWLDRAVPLLRPDAVRDDSGPRRWRLPDRTEGVDLDAWVVEHVLRGPRASLAGLLEPSG